MAYSNLLRRRRARPAQPAIRRIGIADLQDALAKGVDDFYAMPTHAMFLCVIYPIVGLFLARMAFGYSILPLLYPLASGFALVGPVAALGLYELSRRREAGLPTSATPRLRCAPVVLDQRDHGAGIAAADHIRDLGRARRCDLHRDVRLRDADLDRTSPMMC